ncbi:hypothetical protein CHS0354_043126 [Potamilus streckersoni]|uniref:Uncharacterized protein n=1 Tax=Potamilus streckersoni TaxID=2493646 RepID=A0AAE0SBU1_9BIVA|nr:hypothetical protein CHS0354_043126 [Potamilus streckersoni]
MEEGKGKDQFATFAVEMVYAMMINSCGSNSYNSCNNTISKGRKDRLVTFAEANKFNYTNLRIIP